MHELSLAMSVAEIARRELDAHAGGRLRGVKVRVGTLAGVEIDTFATALSTVFASEFPGSDVETAIELVEASAQCLDCGHRFRPDGMFASCPACGSAKCLNTGGRELTVSSLSIERP